MARTTTLGEMRASVLRRGGVENSYDLTPEVVNPFINDALAEVWDVLRKKGDDTLVTSTNLSSTIGSAEVSLPANFYKHRKLEIFDGSSPSGWSVVLPFTLDESHLFGPASGRNYRYRLQGNLIVLSSPTPVVETLRLYFTPCAARLVNDGDTFDGYNGYESLVEETAWRMCLARQRLDTSGSDREIARLTQRVSSDADGRDSHAYPLIPTRSRRDRDDLDDWEDFF